MSLSSLQVLADHRAALLLAEVVAVLHDVGKLSSQFVDQMSQTPKISARFEHESALEINGFVDLQFLTALKSIELRDHLRWDMFQRQQLGQVLDLILHHDKPKHSAFLVRLLSRCDGTDSGADKGTTRQEGLPKEAKQPISKTYIATAFGDESHLDSNGLDGARQQLSKIVGQILGAFVNGGEIVVARSEILRAVQSKYIAGLGETRRSANDVTLWQHSFSVATLYKSAIANLLIAGALDENALHWRLLRVNFDALGLYARAIKIADWLGYKACIDDACAAVKQLVEEEYPLGNEVYRDTTGIYFTFPDLDLPADLAQEIRRRVEQVEMELAPRVSVDPSAPLKTLLSESHKQARDELTHPIAPENLSPCWQAEWGNLPAGRWEVCPVCRLRPMHEKAEACERCTKRRKSRIEWWREHPQQTIWMDELADHNDRVALIVGKFGLDDWLSGDLVQTLLVKAVENNPGECVPKNPSPARLRRVWETCQRFWTETVEGILKNHECAKDDLRCARLLVIPDKKNGWKENVPYDGTLNGQAISLLWHEEAKYFVTISNLQLAAGDAKDVNEFVSKLRGQQIVVSDPDNPRQQISIIVQGAMRALDTLGAYAPYLPLLASPDQFLALVPASDALARAEKIRDEYRKQFGKVQNRLPLFLGIVLFQRKLPLAAVLDTARRMLKVEVNDEQWTVSRVGKKNPSAAGGSQIVEVTLEDGRRQTSIEVSTVMGDCTTPDVWYPYFFVADGVDVNGRAHRFQLKQAGETDAQKVGAVSEKYANRYLVHVNDLHQGDVISVMPSCFAYIYLEHTAQRFEFDVGKNVLLLDELPRLTKMWSDLKQSGITDTGLRGVQALLGAKAAAWGEASQEFERLVDTTLKQAKLFKRKDKDGNALPDIVTPKDVISGRFRRCLELHTTILKLHVKEEKDEQPTV